MAMSLIYLLLVALLGHHTTASPHSRLEKRVEPYGTCNPPKSGGQDPCYGNFKCICKDNTWAQCREQIDVNGVKTWSNNTCWQCQNPFDQPWGSSLTTPDWDSKCAVGHSSQGGGGSSSSSNDNSNSAQQSSSQASSSSSSGGGGDNPFPGKKHQRGNCWDVKAPGGWQGLATVTTYGNQGTSCACGNYDRSKAPWQWGTGNYITSNPSQVNGSLPTASGIGFYSGAVNDKLFEHTRLSNDGKPNCGKKCGSCFDLTTTGTNSYDDGPDSGSTITIMVVDACYNHNGGEDWCGRLKDEWGTDKRGCEYHFDIQTDEYRNDVEVKGKDGAVWKHAGQIVAFREVECPAPMSGLFEKDCRAHCS